MTELSRTQPRKLLVTSALPYANGPIHLGHLLEYIQTDIWVRYQKLAGNDCIYVCADDAHGTAIMLKAEENGITPEEQIANVKREHERDFADFLIGFDNYYSTHSPENRAFSEQIFLANEKAGNILSKEISQLYDPEKQLFLADRFVKGTCPKCGADDQYGDNCEVCSSTYAASELINPRSTISGAIPILRQTTQLFFNLPAYNDMLKQWTRSGALQDAVANKLAEWLEAGLKPWDISREAPYFGFEIPGHPGKYFYVWLDAPIGYMASFKHYCDKHDIDFNSYWQKESKAELYHFIGKDIISFHGLFWPAMLEGAGFRQPTALFAHGFVTINGAKMSKSRGTFIRARQYLDHLDPEYLRYYFAAKLGSKLDDFDLNLDDFTQRVNADLVGKVIQIASRSANFVEKLGGKLSTDLDNADLVEKTRAVATQIAAHYESREYGRAIRDIMQLADAANLYIQNRAPWALAKDTGKQEEVLAVCTTAINVFRLLMIYLKPVLPALATKAEAFLKVAPLAWQDNQTLLLDHAIAPFEPLMQRIEKSQVDALIEAPAPEPANTRKPTHKVGTQMATQDTNSGLIKIDDFSKVELRVARVIEATAVEGADKLLKLVLDVGELGQRQVFSGIKRYYAAEDLKDRLVILVANLAPRKMKFGLSEGMVLAAGDDDVFLLSADSGARPGMKVS
jgi:methionyl-tRNA synthetase